MATINKYKWERLYRKQNWRCFYCLQPFSDKRNGVNALKKATVDHIIPKCELKELEYKEQTYCNTVLACTECNRRKANISAELFLQWYEALNISPYNEQSEYIAVKTRSKRRWYNKYFIW